MSVVELTQFGLSCRKLTGGPVAQESTEQPVTLILDNYKNSLY